MLLGSHFRALSCGFSSCFRDKLSSPIGSHLQSFTMADAGSSSNPFNRNPHGWNHTKIAMSRPQLYGCTNCWTNDPISTSCARGSRSRWILVRIPASRDHKQEDDKSTPPSREAGQNEASGKINVMEPHANRSHLVRPQWHTIGALLGWKVVPLWWRPYLTLSNSNLSLIKWPKIQWACRGLVSSRRGLHMIWGRAYHSKLSDYTIGS